MIVMKFKNWFWGVFFIAAAALIIGNALGLLTNVNLFSLIITILLVPVIIESIYHVNFGGILFPLAILGIVYEESLGITALTPWPILVAALFGTIGLTIVFGAPRRYKFMSHDNKERVDEVVDIPDENIIDYSVRFSSSIKYVNSKALQKANLACAFGALKVYFDNSTLHPDGARINLDVSFSGVELLIPKTWRVVNNANVTLGGIEEKNKRGEDSNSPVIVLDGNVSFSGIEIIYV